MLRSTEKYTHGGIVLQLFQELNILSPAYTFQKQEMIKNNAYNPLNISVKNQVTMDYARHYDHR